MYKELQKKHKRIEEQILLNSERHHKASVRMGGLHPTCPHKTLAKAKPNHEQHEEQAQRLWEETATL